MKCRQIKIQSAHQRHINNRKAIKIRYAIWRCISNDVRYTIDMWRRWQSSIVCALRHLPHFKWEIYVTSMWFDAKNVCEKDFMMCHLMETESSRFDSSWCHFLADILPLLPAFLPIQTAQNQCVFGISPISVAVPFNFHWIATNVARADATAYYDARDTWPQIDFHFN